MKKAIYQIENEITTTMRLLARDKAELKRLKAELREAKKRNRKHNIIFDRDECQTIIHENSTIFLDVTTHNDNHEQVVNKQFKTCDTYLGFRTIQQEYYIKPIESELFINDPEMRSDHPKHKDAIFISDIKIDKKES